MGRVHNLNFICACLVFTTLFASLNANGNKVENTCNLDPKLKSCDTGKFQSPIDLSWGTANVLWYMNPLKRTHKPAPAVIKNPGHGIMIEWEGDAGGVVINGTEYKLRQVHWNTPAKHTLEGERLPVDLHLVHTNSIGKILVIAMSYGLGTPDPFLAELLDTIQSDKVEDIHAGKVDPRKIQFGEEEPYFSFTAPLTVPPCTESVLWNVLEFQTAYDFNRTVSQNQIRALRSFVHDDFETSARLTQSPNRKPNPVYLWENNMAPPDLAPPPPRRN